MNIEQIAFHQGIADWLRFKTKCPPYYRGTPEEAKWKQGQAYARKWNR
jgi:hypothetical protein